MECLRDQMSQLKNEFRLVKQQVSNATDCSPVLISSTCSPAPSPAKETSKKKQKNKQGSVNPSNSVVPVVSYLKVASTRPVSTSKAPSDNAAPISTFTPNQPVLLIDSASKSSAPNEAPPARLQNPDQTPCQRDRSPARRPLIDSIILKRKPSRRVEHGKTQYDPRFAHDNLTRTCFTQISFLPLSSIRRAIVDSGIASKDLVNISYVTQSVVEFLVVSASVEKLVKVMTRAGAVQLCDYDPNIPKDPAASEEMKQQFLKRNYNRYISITKTSRNWVAVDFYTNIAAALVQRFPLLPEGDACISETNNFNVEDRLC